ncbi:hypothetical protein [Kineosporia sp. A_224]|uniref:hypothetical protein n=1 Tax=Kineosporia sp. A_224 TaxID=1962180 RepID=UPI000B4A7285|nr:hypothetical protein [Kineosporia sp. A_224]
MTRPTTRATSRATASGLRAFLATDRGRIVLVGGAALTVFAAGVGVGGLLRGGPDEAVVTVRGPSPSPSAAGSPTAPAAGSGPVTPTVEPVTPTTASGISTTAGEQDQGGGVPAPAGIPKAPVARFDCPATGTRVSSAAQLTAALAAASAGDAILLADGVYTGAFVATAKASAGAPVYLCGSRSAVLDGGSTSGGYVLHLDGAAGWRVSGFTVRNGQKGVMVDGGRGNALQDLLVEEIGDEAVHLRRQSTGNVVRGLTIRDTGRRKEKFGEGVYVGSAESNWCDVNGCSPDRSDGNFVLDNRIGPTTAESVDVKEGTSGGVVAGNVLDGTGLVGADSWVDVKGNGWLVTGNRGTRSPMDGFQTHVVADGWGRDNVFRGNVADLAGGSGVGYYLHKDVPNTVACSNKVTGAAGGLSNRPCT